METSLTAPFARPGPRGADAPPTSRSAAQAPLVRLEPLDGGAPAADAGERVSFAAAEPEPDPAVGVLCRENLDALERLVLGYDVDAAEAARIVADLHGACADLSCDPALIPGEHRAARHVRRPAGADRPAPRGGRARDRAAAQPAGAPARLPALARRRGRGPAGAFVALLRRALAHYGIDSLDRTPALEEACLPAVPLPAAGRDRARRRWWRSSTAGSSSPTSWRGAWATISARCSTGSCARRERRDPVLADLAREVRFRYFDEPVIAARARARLRRDGRAHRGAGRRSRRAGPRAADRRAGRVPAAAGAAAHRSACATPARSCAACCARSSTRRFYRIRTLEGFAEATLDGHPFLLARYRREGPCRHLATAYVALPSSTGAARAFARLGGVGARRRRGGGRPLRRPAGGDRRPARRSPSSCTPRSPRVVLPASVHRIVVTVCRPQQRPRHVGADPVHVPAHAARARRG